MASIACKKNAVRKLNFHTHQFIKHLMDTKNLNYLSFNDKQQYRWQPSTSTDILFLHFSHPTLNYYKISANFD